MNQIIQWNINGLQKHYTDIHRAKFSIQPIAFCFQETNLRPNASFTIRGYIGYFKNRQTNLRASGGVADFVSTLIESTEISIQSNLEVIAISLHTKNPLCICNIYLPDSSNLLLNDLNNIIRQLPKPFLFLGDFNSRNPIWGSNYTDVRGKIVEKFLDNEQIILLNTGEHTRHNVANNSFSSIDLSITSSSLAPKTKWKVLTEYNCSDHWPISIELLDQSPQIPFPPKWNTKKPNWELFNDLISQSITENPIEIDSPINQTTINSLTNKFTHTILTAANKAIGKINHNTKKNLVPWWNHECNESIKRYKRCLNKFKKSNSPLDHIQLKKARAQSRYITKKRKTETWQKYTSSINTNTPSKEVWSKIKAIKGISYHRLPLVLQHNNISLSTPSDIAKAFAEVFQKNSSDSNYDPELATFKDTFEMYTTNEPELDPHPHLNFLNMPFSTSEIKGIQFNLTIDTALYLKNTQIPFHKSLRILGLIFDNKLNWTTHLKQLKVACKVKLNVIKTLANHTWGADKKSLLNIYKTLILSQINYGSPIYNTAKPRHLKTLDPIHHEEILVHNQTTIKHKLPTITNIFTAENYAILEAIKLANSLQTNNFLIISDSLSVLTALKNPWPRSEITQITQSELINTQKTFEFMWVPSHVGIKGNEMADEAASLASNIPHNSTIDKISSYDIFTSVKNKILLSWQHHWDSIPPNNKLKHIKCSVKQWSTPPDLNRRQNIAITRIRIGHTFLTHSFLISKDQPPICNTCQARITIRHIFEVCPIHESTRTLLNLPLNIKEALNEKHTLKTIEFITKDNLINKI
ncbi:hypothetical protein AGLY_008675 [Aphis glycines]|uniref:RNase H type-1 domain-containing protein n=1 Tax=Aphis glycines TaxID=307491 RepID=A0A6G0TM12_APHGL|nr:hypothetical protein AGLY_008675 [Aphis glycines]